LPYHFTPVFVHPERDLLPSTDTRIHEDSCRTLRHFDPRALQLRIPSTRESAMNSVLAHEQTHESQVLFNRALEMMSRNNVNGAIRYLEEALQIAPNNASYLSHYGLCVAMERDDFESATRLCRRAVAMEPEAPMPRVNLGRVLRLDGDNRAAYESFLNAWRLDKHHPAPATELSRMGIRRPAVLHFLPRSHWLNIRLGRLRSRLARALM